MFSERAWGPSKIRVSALSHGFTAFIMISYPLYRRCWASASTVRAFGIQSNMEYSGEVPQMLISSREDVA